jgi:hypothetical protein
MLNPLRVDAAIDLAYGGLILLAIALIATVEFGIGIAFGLGVFSAYVLHVVWKMARFDPDWMTSVVEGAMDETVEEAVEDSVERAVDARLEQQVDETIGDQLDTVQAQVEAVDDRLTERRADGPSGDAATDGQTDEGR